MNRELLEECVGYFRARPVYQKLFQEMQKKYASLGHLGGRMALSDLSSEEKLQLQGFLKKDFVKEEKIVISYSFLEKALAGSKYGELSWQEILEAYLSEKLVKKQDVKEQKKTERAEFFAQLIGQYQDNNRELAEWQQLFLRQRIGKRACLSLRRSIQAIPMA